MHCHLQGTCLGSLTDPLNLSRGASGFILEMLPIYLVLGSYAAFMQLWVGRTAGLAANSVKISCPSCGGHIKFAIQNLGQKIPCPHCQTAVTLRQPENLKMSCFFCKGRIEFPSHALGQKISCPHCKMEVSLKELA
jgi:uncharacterized paraquat-inducible protein A